MSGVRQYTSEEVKAMFLRHVWDMVDYWNRLEEKDRRGALSGLAFSILVTLDGESAALPAFTVAPRPHPDDKQFCIDIGTNWFSPDTDISGDLHESFYQRDPQDKSLKLRRISREIVYGKRKRFTR
jgi:hypothetical protein